MLKALLIRVALSSRSDPDTVEERCHLALGDQDLGKETVAGHVGWKGRCPDFNPGQFKLKKLGSGMERSP